MVEVSVIVPNYNHAPYLSARLDSILKQTYRDFEIIILDDCSTDNSRSIIEQYRLDPKVRHVIYNASNSGNPFQQWIKGMSLASGNLIWIAESDDYSEHTFLEELVTPFQKDPSIVIAFCQSLLVNPDSKIISKTKSTLLTETIEGKVFLEKYMLGINNIINASMVLFKREAASKVYVPFSEMKFCGDWFFWVNLCLFGNVCVSGKYLNYYLRHSESVAPSAIKKGYDFLEGNKIFEFIISNVQVSKHSKSIALSIKADLYYRGRKNFLTEHIRAQVFQSMLTLDPSMKHLMRRRFFKARKEKFRLTIKKIASRFLKKITGIF